MAEFQGGGHGIEVRDEGGEEFLYVCAYQQVKSFAKIADGYGQQWTAELLRMWFGGDEPPEIRRQRDELIARRFTAHVEAAAAGAESGEGFKQGIEAGGGRRTDREEPDAMPPRELGPRGRRHGRPRASRDRA